MRIRSPSAFAPPYSSWWTLEPSTATGRARSSSSGGRNVPPATSNLNARSNSGPTRVDAHAALAAVRLDRAAADDDRHGMQNVRRARDRLGVREAQRTHGVQHAGRDAERARLAGLDRERGRAELRELIHHVAVQAFADRRQQHHGRDADADAERGQRAAHAVRRDGLADQSNEVVAAHRLQRCASASTGSSPAARRAGRMPNTSPLAIATSTADHDAQVGAWKSSTGNAARSSQCRRCRSRARRARRAATGSTPR